MKAFLLRAVPALAARVFTPYHCVVCGQTVDSVVPLCASCLEARFLSAARAVSLAHAAPSRCQKCGIPLVSERDLCVSCRTTPFLEAIDRILPLFPYDAAGQEILTLWKGTGLRAFSPVLAGALSTVLRASGAACGSLVPVPPRPGKIRDKGWDQVEELASLIEAERVVPVRRLLERTSSVQQKRLGRSGRRVNLRGHIQVRSDGAALPDTVTLLDDLMTTGSTLDACAAALKAAGCGKVYGLTLFYD